MLCIMHHAKPRLRGCMGTLMPGCESKSCFSPNQREADALRGTFSSWGHCCLLTRHQCECKMCRTAEVCCTCVEGYCSLGPGKVGDMVSELFVDQNHETRYPLLTKPLLHPDASSEMGISLCPFKKWTPSICIKTTGAWADGSCHYPAAKRDQEHI